MPYNVLIRLLATFIIIKSKMVKGTEGRDRRGRNTPAVIYNERGISVNKDPCEKKYNIYG